MLGQFIVYHSGLAEIRHILSILFALYRKRKLNEYNITDIGNDHCGVRRKLFQPEENDKHEEVNEDEHTETAVFIPSNDPSSKSSSPIDIASRDENEQTRSNNGTAADDINKKCELQQSLTATTNSSFSGPITLTGSGRHARRIIGQPTKRPSYKLLDLHQRIIGREPPESHKAEDDCLTLARIFWLTPNAPLWADVNAVPLDMFDPLYTPKKRHTLLLGVFPSSC